MSRKYPDRWLAYTKFGTQVEGTSFIPLKVPLNKVFFVNREEDSFTPDDAIDEIPKLGLVVDLTFTAKYYSPTEFTQRNVKHKKIYTKGHEIPNLSLVNRFIQTVNDFLNVEENKDKLIGVHCTHGLNRTGYFVCAYMILAQGQNPKNAINIFNNARSHSMERANYLNSLTRLTPGSYSNATQNGTERRGPRNGGTEQNRHQGNRYGSNRRYNHLDRSENWRSGQTREDFRQPNRPPYRDNSDRPADWSENPRNAGGGQVQHNRFQFRAGWTSVDRGSYTRNHDQPNGSRDWKSGKRAFDTFYASRKDKGESSSHHLNGDHQSNRSNKRDVNDNSEC